MTTPRVLLITASMALITWMPLGSPGVDPVLLFLVPAWYASFVNHRNTWKASR